MHNSQCEKHGVFDCEAARSAPPLKGGWGDESFYNIDNELIIPIHPPSPLQRGNRPRVISGIRYMSEFQYEYHLDYASNDGFYA